MFHLYGEVDSIRFIISKEKTTLRKYQNVERWPEMDLYGTNFEGGRIPV